MAVEIVKLKERYILQARFWVYYNIIIGLIPSFSDLALSK